MILKSKIKHYIYYIKQKLMPTEDFVVFGIYNANNEQISHVMVRTNGESMPACLPEGDFYLQEEFTVHRKISRHEVKNAGNDLVCNSSCSA